MSSIAKLDFGHIAQPYSLAHVLFTIEHRKRVKQHLSCFTISWKILTNSFPCSVCHSERLFWAWVDGVIVHDSQTRVDPEKLSKDDVLYFIHQHYQP